MNKKTQLLSDAPVSKALLAVGLPAMIGMMINALYNLVDAYFVSGMGKSQMGAITVAFPLGQVVVGLGLLFGNGAASYISRLLGSGDTQTADKAASTALYSSISVGAVIIASAVIFLKPILILIGTTDTIMPYAVTYTRIYLISSILNIFNVTMNNLATSEGCAKTAMCALLSGAVLNIALDPLFISVFELGVAGAAAATAISQAVSSAVYIMYISEKKSVFSFRINKCSFTGNIILQILKIGVPTLIFQLLTSFSIVLINRAAKPYGDSVISGMGVVTRIISMGSLMVFGYTKGLQPVAGYSFGARKYDRLKEAIKLSVIWTSIFCFVFGAAAAIFSVPLVSKFSKGDSQMITVASAALRANGLSFTLFGFYTVYSSLFLALGKAKRGFVLGACRQGIFFIPVLYILTAFLKVNGVVYSQPAADVLSALAAVVMAVQLHRELNKNSQPGLPLDSQKMNA
ncbi:MAG: MATE family efflux transporter [Oscillospiraceae bacterium]|nr:MATE family efflux transporter [Oscillospiraceae bacterium]